MWSWWSFNYETPVRPLAISDRQTRELSRGQKRTQTGAKTQLLNTLSTLTQTHASTFRHQEPEARALGQRYY